MDLTRSVVSPRYKPEVMFALSVQMFVGLLALLLLDGGQMARVVGVAAFAFWLITAFFMARRPQSPTAFDLAFIRWGFWPIYVVAVWVQFGL